MVKYPKCPKCGYQRKPEDDFVSREECPSCGVLYEKALEEILRQKNEAEAKEEMLRKREEAWQKMSATLQNKDKNRAPKQFICPHCGHTGRAPRKSGGSFGLEIVLWIFCILIGGLFFIWLMIVPVAYSAWRFVAKHRTCESCGQKDPIPVTSPRGKILVAQYQESQATN